MKLSATLIVMMLAGPCAFAGAVPADSQLSARASLSGGMGVEYVSAPDVVEYVNTLAIGYGATQRVSEFKAGVGFFGALACPVSTDLILKAEYVYLLVTYNPNIPIGASEFTLSVHMPSLILQYVLWDERLYNVKVGGGLGYHFASLSTKYAFVDDNLTGKGFGAVIDLEANTAFGDHLFAYLGGDLRFEFIGRLKNASDVSLSQPINLPTMNSFSIGARLGFSYFF